MFEHPIDTTQQDRIRPELWCLIAITLLVTAVFAQSFQFGFIDFDDSLYVSENRHVAQGLTSASIQWAWTTYTAGNWHPLTWLSLMADVEFFGGISAGGHHAVNVLIHWINTLLVFAIFRQATGSVWRSTFCALLFAVHPLRAESVVWISERKDVLSAGFGLYALWMYCRYAHQPSGLRYVAMLLFFAASLLSKPMWVTFPFLLLVVDYWPLDRYSRTRLPRLVLEKIPFLILSVSASVMAILSQHASGAIKTLSAFPVTVRCANAIVAYVKYLLMFLWPSDLALLYPHPAHHPAWLTIACGLVLITITAWIWWGMRRPHLIAGWLWFLGTLVPVIGIVQIGSAELADRYTYVPIIGIGVMVAWLWPDPPHRPAWQRTLSRAVAVAWVVALAGAAWLQTGLWASSEAIMTHTLAVTRNNYIIHTNLGYAHMKAGRLDEALHHIDAALVIRPGHLPAFNNLGAIYQRQGRLDEAITIFSRIAQQRPDFIRGITNLANAHEHNGDMVLAKRLYRRTLEKSPDNQFALAGLGRIDFQNGDYADALEWFRKGLSAGPESVDLKNDIGAALIMLNRPEEARRWLLATLEAHPESADTAYYLGELMKRSGQPELAKKLFGLALSLEPDHAKTQSALASANDTVQAPSP